MSLNTRLARIASALSGYERALLVLRSMKDDTPEDPAWRRTMPPEQYHDFNRCIRLINAATQEARVLINLLEDKADCLELREGWLVSVTLWNEHVQEIRDAFRILGLDAGERRIGVATSRPASNLYMV